MAFMGEVAEAAVDWLSVQCLCRCLLSPDYNPTIHCKPEKHTLKIKLAPSSCQTGAGGQDSCPTSQSVSWDISSWLDCLCTVFCSLCLHQTFLSRFLSFRDKLCLVAFTYSFFIVTTSESVMLLDSYRMQGGAPSFVSTKGSVHGQQLRESISKWSNPLPFLDESGIGPNSGHFLWGLIVLSLSPLHTAPALEETKSLPG